VGLDHLLVSLSQLRNFSHSQCDAVLQARQIEVINAYNPHKSGFERDTVYFGLYWDIGCLLLVIAGLVYSWRRKDANSRTARFVLPFFLLFGLGLLYVQLQAMAVYADACQRILGAPSRTPPSSELVDPAVAALIILAFAGCWYSILLIKYRDAKSTTARLLPLAMMILGGAFFAYAILHLFH